MSELVQEQQDETKQEATPQVPNGMEKAVAWRGEMTIGEQGFTIKTVDDAWFAARMIVNSGFNGKTNDSVAKCFIAILMGQKHKIDPVTAVNRIAVINGLPTIWGDLMLGLVEKSGFLEDIREWDDGEGDAYCACCEVKRKGRQSPTVRVWSRHDNRVAGLEGRNVHKTFPKRMLQMRARAFALRDAFADVLCGPRRHPQRAADNDRPGAHKGEC